MVWCGSAAAAQNGRSVLEEILGAGGKGFRLYIKYCLSIFQTRQACVGLDHYRQMGGGYHLLKGLPQLFWPQGAVDAHHVSPKACKRNGGGSGFGSQKGPAILAKGHGNKHWQCGALLGS